MFVYQSFTVEWNQMKNNIKHSEIRNTDEKDKEEENERCIHYTTRLA